MHLLSRMFFLAIVVATMLLPGCYEDEGNPVDVPNRVRFELTNHVMYATPQDTALILVYCMPYTAQEITMLVDFGDGAIAKLSSINGKYQQTRHLYRSTGTFTVVATAMSGSEVLETDTATVEVIDYICPTLATKIRVEITGIDIWWENIIQRPGTSDSVAISVTRDFQFETAEYFPSSESKTFPWGGYNRFSGFDVWAADPADTVTARSIQPTVELTPDGAFLVGLELSYSDTYSMISDFRHERKTVHVYSIPLDRTTPPTRERAVYSIVYPKVDSQILSSQISHWRYINSASEYLNIRSSHISPYSDVTVTVEFFK